MCFARVTTNKVAPRRKCYFALCTLHFAFCTLHFEFTLYVMLERATRSDSIPLFYRLPPLLMGILSRFKKRSRMTRKTILSLPCVKGGGFALAKTEGLFWVYICVKKIYLIAKQSFSYNPPPRKRRAPFTQRGLIMHFAF